MLSRLPGKVKRIKRTRGDERGFTLIELMVVLVIIGILVALLLVRLTGRTDPARERAAMSDLRTMKSVIEVYYADNGELPGASNIEAVMKDGGINWSNPGTRDPWGKGYGYKKIDADSYILISKGKDKNKNTADDIYATEIDKPTVGDPTPDVSSMDGVSGADTW
ncbi:MAG: prepilin-type N-terminal cleavage/methylation domain-containing protein [Bacillota bacterium]